jgi:hypothetical protein
MTQLSIFQYGYLVEAVAPFLHFLLIAGILLVLLEAAVLLGDVLGSSDPRARRD